MVVTIKTSPKAKSMLRGIKNNISLTKIIPVKTELEAEILRQYLLNEDTVDVKFKLPNGRFV